MSALLWLCLSLLSFAVLSTHARPQPAGMQGNINTGKQQDGAKESAIFRRGFELSMRDRLAAPRTLNKHQRQQRSAHPCLESPLKCLRSTSQPIELPPELQPMYNYHHLQNVCSLPNLFLNIHIYKKCANLLFQKSSFHLSKSIPKFFSNVFRAHGNVLSDNQQPPMLAQKILNTPTFPASREFLQEGVWKFNNELKIEGQIFDETDSIVLDDSNKEHDSDFTVTSLFVSRNGNKRNTDNSIDAVNTDTLSITRTRRSASSVMDDVKTSPSTYVTMIFELLPIIREGYRNNAFNDEDKAVIRRIFGDMKITIDEESKTSNLNIFRDQTTIKDDVIGDFDYEGTEDTRNKRFKEDYNILKTFADITPNQLRKDVIFSSDKLRRARSPGAPSGAEAAAVLALLAENDSHVVLEPEDDDEDDDYDEYYEYEVEQEEDEEDEDDAGGLHDYENGSFKELIKLAEKHKQRKAKEGQ